MAKIKYTKNELKAQRDALRRFTRYLPTLQLKKQQLQMEIRNVEQQMLLKEQQISDRNQKLEAWVALFSFDFDFSEYLSLERVLSRAGNIAGVKIPEIDEITFRRTVPDLFATPLWIDQGLVALEELIRLRLELAYLREQQRLLQEELRVTSQRVNLFEKVKIPESREHIRVIQIFLGDQQTAAVARAKIAKNKAVSPSETAR